VLVELVRVHEPLLEVVVVPVVARLTAVSANIRLDSSITERVANSVFKAPPCGFQRGLEVRIAGPAEIAVLSRKAPLRTRIALSVFINSRPMEKESSSLLRTSVLLGRTGLGNLLVRSM
jgi:hypothetical protein